MKEVIKNSSTLTEGKIIYVILNAISIEIKIIFIQYLNISNRYLNIFIVQF